MSIGFQNKDIAQLNATIMVGLLFILGLTNLFPNTKVFGLTVLVITAALILPPFAISIIISLIGPLRLAKWFTVASLGWLLFWAFTVLIVYF
jgi:hypothetical protein